MSFVFSYFVYRVTFLPMFLLFSFLISPSEFSALSLFPCASPPYSVFVSLFSSVRPPPPPPPVLQVPACRLLLPGYHLLLFTCLFSEYFILSVFYFCFEASLPGSTVSCSVLIRGFSITVSIRFVTALFWRVLFVCRGVVLLFPKLFPLISVCGDYLCLLCYSFFTWIFLDWAFE